MNYRYYDRNSPSQEFADILTGVTGRQPAVNIREVEFLRLKGTVTNFQDHQVYLNK